MDTLYALGILVAIIFSIYIVHYAAKARKSDSWPMVIGVIENNIIIAKGGTSTGSSSYKEYYEPVIEYKYKVAGKHYKVKNKVFL